MSSATGPRTPRGKSRSSQNAAKHWIESGRILPSEQDEARALHRGLVEYVEPSGIENEIVNDLVFNIIRRPKGALSCACFRIGLKGCYIDLLNPLPAGLSISVKIFKNNQTFEEEGQVVYAHPTMGMGVVFTRMNTDHKKVLEGWIHNLEK